MAPKAAKGATKRKTPDDASTSQAPPPSPDYILRRGNPPTWPRDENTPFQIELEPRKRNVTLKSVLTSDEVARRDGCSFWDDFDALLYNEWLRVPLSSTRYMDERSLLWLNIKGEVKQLVQGMGLTKLVTKTEAMFPDLVRQFFASVKLFNVATSDEEKRDPKNYFMSFMANGKRHQINCKGVCAAFDFPLPENHPVVGLPKDIDGGVATLWSKIGTNAYNGDNTAQADVRHPVIRYLLRLISTTILCKREPVKARSHELILLSYALRDIIPNETWETTVPNMGMVLMEYLHSIKHTPLSLTNPGKRSWPVGSLLTPIFKKCNVSRIGYLVETNHAFVDMEHMKNAHWITTVRAPIHWIFPIAGDQKMEVELKSVIDLLSITTDPSLVHFDPPAELLHPIGTSRKFRTRGASTSGASTSQATTSHAQPSPPPQGEQQHDHEHRFPQLPAGELDDTKRFEWISKVLKATWDAMACRSTCMRPRTPSPPPHPSSQDSQEHMTDEEEN